MHLDEGTLRAFLDQEIDPEQRGEIETHLASCPACHQTMQLLQSRSQGVDQRLSALGAPDLQPRLPIQAARQRLERRLQPFEKETLPMKIFSRLSRPAWAAIVVVALLAVSLAFPSVRAIANNFLGLFRVEKVSIVRLDNTSLPNELGSSSQFQSLMSTDVKIEQIGEQKEAASREEAQAETGFPLRLPTQLDGDPKLMLQPGGTMDFTINLEHVRLVLDEIGRSDIQIPASVDGANVHMNIPIGVSAQYGDCKFDPEEARQRGYDPDSPNSVALPACTHLMQIPSPTIEAPEGLDIEKIGEAYLQVLGMSPEDAASFAQTVDWTSTFVVPVPTYNVDYTDVAVDGVTGTLMMQDLSGRPDEYVLFWIKDGMLYSLTGYGSADQALSLANSLQ